MTRHGVAHRLAGVPCSHPCVNFTKKGNMIMIEKTEKGKVIRTPLRRGPCALCASIALHRGTHVEILAPGRGGKHRKSERRLPGDRRVPSPSWACKICKVRLCKKVCFARWDHVDNCAPVERALVLA